MTGSAIVFGGLGFIGSHIARSLVRAGWQTTIVDGLIPKTGGNERRLDDVAESLNIVKHDVREFPGLTKLISDNDVVIDAMGWTQHLAAFEDPLHDMGANLTCHSHLAMACVEATPKLVLYLGSTGQYGRPPDQIIEENTPFRPLDIQGIHKSAADHFWQIMAKRYGLSLICLRFGNTFGPGQPTVGHDIGLIGDFVRTLFNRDPIRVFGANRSRNILFVEDLASLVCDLVAHPNSFSDEYLPFNIAGCRLTIKDLASKIIDAVGSGTYIEEGIPDDVARLDTGYATIQDDRLVERLGPIQYTPIDDALAQTVDWFLGELTNQTSNVT